MTYFVLALMVAAAAVVLGKAAGQSGTATLLGGVRFAAGIVLSGIAVMLSLAGTRGFILAVPTAALGLALLLNRWPGGLALPGTSGGAWRNGPRSTVRTTWLEMELEHQTGIMAGRVLAGRFAQRDLQSLTENEFIELHHEALGDPQSVQLIEAFMDREFGGWRERHSQHDSSQQGTSAAAMTREEAFEILGLSEDAGPDDIRDAHHNLMKKFHPDQGGSTFLAKKINAAKDMLLRQRS